ncbi:putative cell wall-binding protein [Microbacteriaceae bacterium SG_E_30_P1]|uniref:Cell wall-binding protein n=1 Tax=Antiquaquibacter oligotrophicus TaxID=2880260 RepID=A0ABT6KQT0_9MICO|nr:cell wall-binding repeat-containing protein [Antiquaquibacter oligotrophicus]MDH6182339.1 putative cell wall-binding protein [Antiquaquibacter oligotrophicus]UDF12008.1 cell wall-binding repeat-containing protein [Antiquaquibacter oligotrophicus]
MTATGLARARVLALVPLVAASLLLPVAATTATAAPLDVEPDLTSLPDPMDRGDYTPAVIQETKLGLVDLQEPNSSGTAPGTGQVQSAEQMQIRGQLYYPADRTEPSPVLILVHGNHGSCDVNGNTAVLSCNEFKRNEAGYAYLAENLATWGYTTFSVSQDQMMMRQDNAKGKGMHQRRLLIAAALDALSAANAEGGLPVDANTTIGTTLVGKLDMTRIGLMGHSRGGDGVTSFIDYNRMRTDGPRYPLRGVISLAPVDYERKAPYGVPYMSILPWCDGDVSNLQGARFFERAQYVNGDNAFPVIQSSQLGANHNWYNTVWFADGQDGGNVADAACGNSQPTNSTNVQPNNLRLSGASSYDTPWPYVINNTDTYNPLVNTKISGDPEKMGDQEKIGLATMAAFFRRYVGGEGAFEPYMTGELSTTENHYQIPESACPTSESGIRIDCAERVSTSYFPPASERVDLIRPEIENPLTLNALGGTLSGTGFAYPYLDNGGVTLPAPTAQGFDWCNPEPDHFAPSQLGISTQPTGAKACPLPGKAELGGQNGTRENSPVNHSYGRQLALAWEAGTAATLTADIPAASSDMSGLKALAMGADVNFFDTRNPGTTRTENGVNLPVTYNPEATTQDFVIALIDSEGNEATVNAGDERWGNALHMSTGTTTARTHIVLDQIRVPLAAFEGVDLTSLDRLELRFGVEGTPSSGSIQLADVRFQEAVTDAPLILSDGTEPDQGAGYGAPATGPDPADYLFAYDATPGELILEDTTGNPASNSTWVVDDDMAQCPSANFTSIQAAVNFAAPWDTIVVCEGTYVESTTPTTNGGSPAQSGSKNGLHITKPLRIKGAGADKVTIMPDQSLTTLAGTAPYLRDGGGNVISVTRQSLGSTDTNELFLDLSGVTVTSGTVEAEAGIAFFNAAGRVSDSVIGVGSNPMGWGIVKTGSIRGAGPGTVESEVTVHGSVVTGFRFGGILFDGGLGADGAAGNLERSGIIQHGYVSDTVVTGAGSLGVRYTNGVDGFIKNSRITGNEYGVLLSDAKTETDDVAISGSVITGNTYSVYNANAATTAVREGAPVTVTGSYLASDPVSPVDTQSNPTVIVESPAAGDIEGVPTGVGSFEDAAPTAKLVDPADGEIVNVGQTITPIAKALDDFAVSSATLVVNGTPFATGTVSPFTFTWAPGAELRGTDVTLTTIVTDSAGQQTESSPITITVPDITVDRIAGATRYDVAVGISQQAYPSTAPVVYVASGANYPDALSAGPAAAYEGGPLLLVGPDEVPAAVSAEIARLDPAKIVVVGGTASVTEGAFNTLSALADETVRIAGANRYEVSRSIAEYAFPDEVPLVYIATGEKFPDALAAGGAAGSKDAPVLLVRGSATDLDDASAALLESLGTTQTRVLGGEASVTPGVFDDVDAIATATRLGGADRYEAARTINADAFVTAERAFLATGLNFPDALAGSAWAASAGAPLYVAPGTCVTAGVLADLQALGVTSVTLLGGEASLTPEVFALTPCA